MRQKIRAKAAGKPAPQPAGRHPHIAAMAAPLVDGEGLADQPFAEGSRDELDPDLRHRMISEVAFHRQAERGYDEGYDRDDWRDAEAEVDHVLIGAKALG